MKTKFGKAFAALSMAGLLASLNLSATAAEPVETPEIRAAAQKAVTRSDHEAVAKFYEDAARQMQVKVKEQKELLEHYENKSYLYGRQAQDLQSHTYAQVRDYEQAVEVNIREASLHRQMASKLEKNHAASVIQDPAL
jgi:hypothetical protein